MHTGTAEGVKTWGELVNTTRPLEGTGFACIYDLANMGLYVQPVHPHFRRPWHIQCRVSIDILKQQVLFGTRACDSNQIKVDTL